MATIGRRHAFEAIYLGGNAQQALLSCVTYINTKHLYRDHVWCEHDNAFEHIKRHAIVQFTAEIAYYMKKVRVNGRMRPKWVKELVKLDSIWQVS